MSLPAVWCYGNVLYEVCDATFPNAGKIALWVDSVEMFDDLVITIVT
ncbi:MAG: hypothetical protein ACKVP3_18060 [Hyphomicrobiaceae bacterium]